MRGNIDLVEVEAIHCCMAETEFRYLKGQAENIPQLFLIASSLLKNNSDFFYNLENKIVNRLLGDTNIFAHMDEAVKAGFSVSYLCSAEKIREFTKQDFKTQVDFFQDTSHLQSVNKMEALSRLYYFGQQFIDSLEFVKQQRNLIICHSDVDESESIRRVHYQKMKALQVLYLAVKVNLFDQLDAFIQEEIQELSESLKNKEKDFVSGLITETIDFLTYSLKQHYTNSAVYFPS